MYLAMRSLMEAHQAQAITINCLGGFYGGSMQAYPCLGHFQLNNDGLVGACEADLQSTITMLLMGYLVGRPGYISDPVVDTATGRVIYVHCVATNKVFGPGGPTNPYQILSHAEDRKGAALRSLMPLGELVTTLQTAPTRREMIIHQAKTSGNVDDDRSCRTKLAAEPQGRRQQAAHPVGPLGLAPRDLLRRPPEGRRADHHADGIQAGRGILTVTQRERRPDWIPGRDGLLAHVDGIACDHHRSQARQVVDFLPVVDLATSKPQSGQSRSDPSNTSD